MSSKTALIVSGVAAGAVVALLAGKGGAGTATPANGGIVITPGSGTVGGK